MSDEVEGRPALLQRGEDAVDRAKVLDIAGQGYIRADAFSERPDALAQGVALIGEGQLGAMIRKRLGDTPGDGMIVGDAHDEAALSGHQTRCGAHIALPPNGQADSARPA